MTDFSSVVRNYSGWTSNANTTLSNMSKLREQASLSAQFSTASASLTGGYKTAEGVINTFIERMLPKSKQQVIRANFAHAWFATELRDEMSQIQESVVGIESDSVYAVEDRYQYISGQNGYLNDKGAVYKKSATDLLIGYAEDQGALTNWSGNADDAEQVAYNREAITERSKGFEPTRQNLISQATSILTPWRWAVALSAMAVATMTLYPILEYTLKADLSSPSSRTAVATSASQIAGGA